MSITLEDLKAHCERTIEPNGKIVFDMTSKVYQEHAMVLALINEHEKNRWIPVTERLPEKCGESYIVCLQNGHIDIATCMYDGRLTFICEHGVREVYDTNPIIAWMPLPEPFTFSRKVDVDGRTSRHDRA